MGRNADDPGVFGRDEEEWQRWAQEQLEDVEYDTELGLEMAVDARRVSAGELSKAEFYDRYHEDVTSHFGVDERPHGDEQKTQQGALPSIPSRDTRREPSRRSMLKAAGGVAAGAALAGCLSFTQFDSAREVVDAVTEDAEGPQMGMVIDLNACTGAMDCMIACKDENNTSPGVHWPFVVQFARGEPEDPDDPVDEYMPLPCQHCSRPTCEYMCPTGARYRREDDGIVLEDYDLCIGCKYCIIGCPYGVNYIQWHKPRDDDGFEYDREDRHGVHVAGNPPKGVAGKCTFCVQRQDSGDDELVGTTACAEACPWGAISFGDLTDEEDDPQQHLQQVEAMADTFRLLESFGNEPNVIYVGTPPGSNARYVETDEFAENGLIERRRDFLDGTITPDDVEGGDGDE